MVPILNAVPALFQSMRPRQWTKNVLFVFPAIVFSGQMFQADLLARVLLCCALMILTSGSVYIFNDVVDVDSDRRHPTKKNRPIAASKLPLPLAKAAAMLIPLLALAAAYTFDRELMLVILTYYALQLAYSLKLKHVVLLDILAVAAGFVLRLLAGGIVIDTNVSPWLYSSVGLLALLLVIGKRRQELILLGENAAAARPIFQHYNLPLLDDMLRFATTSTVLTYIIYIVENDTLVRSGMNLGLLTVPPVLYGIFRYLYLLHVRRENRPPDEILLTDRPLQAALVAAALLYFVILYVL